MSKREKKGRRSISKAGRRKEGIRKYKKGGKKRQGSMSKVGRRDKEA
jgi:hypothetical protein